MSGSEKNNIKVETKYNFKTNFINTKIKFNLNLELKKLQSTFNISKDDIKYIYNYFITLDYPYSKYLLNKQLSTENYFPPNFKSYYSNNPDVTTQQRGLEILNLIGNYVNNSLLITENITNNATVILGATSHNPGLLSLLYELIENGIIIRNEYASISKKTKKVILYTIRGMDNKWDAILTKITSTIPFMNTDKTLSNEFQQIIEKIKLNLSQEKIKILDNISLIIQDNNITDLEIIYTIINKLSSYSRVKNYALLKENKYLKKFGYIGESDYDRVIEYLIVITNYVKQMNKSSPEHVSSQIATLFHLRGDSVPYSRKLFFKIVSDNTNNNGLIQLNYVKFKEVSYKPLSYYSIVGSNIKLIQNNSTLSTLGSIIIALQDHPNGITAENLRKDSHILEKEHINANLNILKEKNIIVRHKEKEITYLPSIEERIFTIIKNNVDNVDKNIIDVYLNEQLRFIQEQGVDINYKVDIKHILDQLVETGLIIYNDETLTYQTDKKEYNAFLGLVKEQYNSSFKYDSNNTDEFAKISTNIIQDYVNYPDNFYILKFLVDNYDSITLFTANEIYNTLKSKFSRQISLSTVKDYIYGYRNRPSFFKMHGFIDIYVQQQLKEMNKNTNRDIKKKWIILNSNSSVLAKSILYMYFNFQPIQHGFGTYIYPIFFNYVLGDIINNSLHTIDELIKYINESDNKTKFILSILKSINGNVSISEIIHSIFKGIHNFNDKNILQSINNLLKYGDQTNIGSDNNDTLIDTLISSDFFIIDLRKFMTLNNNDINKGIDTFTNLLLWKDKSYKFQILNIVKRKSLTYLNNASDEYMLVEFLESFWDIFGKFIYGNEFLDLVNSIKLILNFIDNNLNPDTYEELGNSKSNNTKFFEYLTDGINSQQDFQNVYSSESDLKTIKIQILYDIILSLLASTINNQTAKGHAMTENDKTGWNAWSTVDRIGGHSDTAFNLPERWFSLNSYNYSYSTGYNNWWKNNKIIGDIDLEFKNIAQRKNQLLKLSQYYYLLGQPNPAGIPSNNNKSNNDILKENLTKYCNQPINLHSNNFLSIVFEIIKIYGNPIKSILGISRPITMKYIINQQERAFEAINIISIMITSLDVYKNILTLNNSLLAIYTDNTLNNTDIIEFFDSLGIHSSIYNENSTKMIKILSIDDEILYKMNNQVKNPASLLLVRSRKNY